MGEPKASADQRAFEEIAGDLYALKPDAFAEARDAAVKKARAEGEAELAKEIAALRRPVQSAWLINLLWRQQAPLFKQLLDLSDELRDAQERGDAAELLRLTTKRRELEASLLNHVRALARDADVGFTTSAEQDVRNTLTAAVLNPEVAAEVRSGRLLKPASYAGFGPAPDSTSLAVKEAAPRAPTPSGKQTRKSDAGKARELEARKRLADAKDAVGAAASALAEGERAVEQARAEQVRLAERMDELEAERREVRGQMAAADRAVLEATRRRAEADKAHKAALRGLEAAERATE